MDIHNKSRLFLLLLLPAILLVSCSPSLPKDYDDSDVLPRIYPDYVGVTIPVNIAPLTFELDEKADAMVARYTSGDCEIVCAGKMQPKLAAWRKLVAAALNTKTSTLNSSLSTPDSPHIQVDVFARHDGCWTHYRPFTINISSDSIDPWLSYRLIPPSYVSYEALTISQRCLENYDERVIYDNMLCGLEVNGQCINCHSYQQYNPQRMQFHARQNYGGTVIAYDGELKKVNMKNDSIISAGVYPAWHPWMKLIVYSTNHTYQNFFTVSRDKIEVYDSESDLIAYDIDTDEVTNIENRSDELEVFPAWAPDGRTLYFSSARFVRNDSIKDATTDVVARYDSLHYNIYCKSFDPQTKRFGPRRPVIVADSLLAGGGSALLPRISPDGRYLLFSMAPYGVFHIWHHAADLWMKDLQTGAVRPLDEVNSPDTESYHTWSSNGKWIVFSSRRDDGTFTRPFFSQIDEEGVFSKPFELPCADPDYHRQLMKCYNIPEFLRSPVTYRPHDFARLLKGEGVTVKYVRQLSE
ncbi:MAG: PD40 domain-containing protein [Bacteroidaceae bacterium]|nr:PD40 domain-containing protein [Bacteroidaceae bacterium]